MSRRCLGLSLALLLLALHSVFGDKQLPTAVSPTPAAGPTSSVDAEQSQRRYREGTRLTDRIGYFQVTGDRVAFYSQQDDRRFPALENLALERVARVVGESSSDAMQWSVSGILTEYRGENYLLVTRAILKSESAGP